MMKAVSAKELLKKLFVFCLCVACTTLTIRCAEQEIGEAGESTVEKLSAGPEKTEIAASQNSESTNPGFEPKITGKALPQIAHNVLREILISSKTPSAKVSSISRTPAHQARVMYEYVKRHGAQAGYKLYGPEGDAIIKVFEKAGDRDRQTIIDLMLKETLVQLPIAHANNRLMHTNSTHYVFDISFRSIPQVNRPTLLAAAKAHPRVFRILGPDEGEKDAFHLEIAKKE
ncbi:MAG: hypothetical protein DWQ05_14950 [Calditrichaeota bacterium]|nr:MAG: hypothetical protein DWQ05_14950 [Calditrichota bacterium]